MPTQRPLVISFSLWRMFYRILPQHPVFWRKLFVRKPPHAPLTRRGKLRRLLVGFMVTALMLPILLVMSLMLGVAAVLLLLFGGLVSGLQAALGVGAAVALEYQFRRGEHIAMTPSGTVGLCWALGARHIRTDKTSLRLRRLIVAVIAFVAIGVAFVGVTNFVVVVLLGVSSVNSDTGAPMVDGLAVFVPLINGVVMLGVLYADLIQSTILGAMAGMIAGVSTRERVGALWLASALFLGGQLAFYVFVALVIRLWVLAASPLEALLLMLFQVALILLVREVMIHGAVWVIERTLNTDWAELVTMPRLGS